MALALSSSQVFTSSAISSSRRDNVKLQSSLQVHANLPSFDGLRVADPLKHSLPSPLLVQGATNAASVSTLSVRATAAEAPPLALPKQKIRIKLRSYWVPRIEEATKQILEAARSTDTKIMGPVPLPTKRKVFCVLRSPHVNKDSREHFEIRTHQRLIDLENPNAGTIDALMQLDLPAGVDVEVKLS